MRKYLLMNYGKESLIDEAIKNCLDLFAKSTEKMMVIDTIGSYLTRLLTEGRNLKFPAVEDNTYIRSMGKTFVIKYDDAKVDLISLVAFILWTANEISYADNPNQKLFSLLRGYEIA